MMPWYEQFFDEDYMRFHLRGGGAQADRAPAECDFIIQTLELKPGDRILDLCCGQGRHSVELTKREFRVSGVDLSEYLLVLAKKTAYEAGVDARFHCCDMRELLWEAEFDVVINMFTSFGYFESDEENEKALRAARKALRPGGRLLLDLPNREFFAKAIRQGQRDWLEHDGCLVLEEWIWSEDSKRLRMNRTIVERDWSRRLKSFDLREYTHPEVLEMLARTGLEWQRTFADLNMSDFQPEARRMLIIARRGE